MAVETPLQGMRIISPNEAANYGFFPREYVELPKGWRGWHGKATPENAAQLSSLLQEPETALIAVYPAGLTSLEGNTMSIIQRDNGPRATVKDYLTYGWKKLKSALPF